jgi:hypothetical protein
MSPSETLRWEACRHPAATQVKNLTSDIADTNSAVLFLAKSGSDTAIADYVRRQKVLLRKAIIWGGCRYFE